MTYLSRAVLRAVLFILAMLICPAWNLHAQDMPRDLEQIRESGHLRIAIIQRDIPPFVFERDGELHGSDVDMAKDIAASLGVAVEFIRPPGGYDAVIDVVATNRADLGISELTKTPGRAKVVYLSRPYMISGLTLLVNRLSLARLRLQTNTLNVDEIRPVALNMPGYSIVTMAGSSTQGLLEEHFPRAVHRSATDWVASAMEVYAGEADAALISDSSYQTLIHKLPALEYKTKAIPLGLEDPLTIAVRPGLPDLARWINDYLDFTAYKRKASLADLVQTYLADEGMMPPGDAPAPKDQAQPEPVRDSGVGWLTLAALHVAAFGAFWFFVIRRKRETHWLFSPWAVLGGMALGGITGCLQPDLAESFGPPAAIYMNFWRLCVLPIMITTIVTSIYRLLVGGNNMRLVKRLLIVIPIALLLLSLVGVVAGVIGRPGADFPPEAQSLLVKDVASGMKNLERQGMFDQFMDMARNIVPDNLLKPFVENQSLAVLFVAIIFGVMLARSSHAGRDTLVSTLDTVLEVFTRMIRASLYLLPPALYALALDFTARTGLEMLGAVFRLSVCMALALAVPLVFAVIAMRVRMRTSLKSIVKDFGSMFLVAFSSRSSVIAMPLGLEALAGRKDLNRDQAQAAYPLTLLICHSGMAIFFSLTPIFVGQAFQVDFTLGQYVFIVIGSLLSTLASTGTIGMSFVMLLSITCGPLGLPLEPSVLVGLALVAIVDPIISGVQVLFGCGLTAILVENTAGGVEQASDAPEPVVAGG